jgi:hypothetical protein
VRFMVIRRADEQTEAGVLPSPELLDAMTKYNEELVKAGVMLDGMGLKDSSHGSLVSFQSGKPTVVDGPFTEAKELVAGFSLWECASKEEAIEWLKKWPKEDGDVVLELRQVFTEEDFGDNLTQETKARMDNYSEILSNKETS